LAEAEDEFNIALDAAREAGDKRAIAMQMRNLAVLAHARGETVTACDGCASCSHSARKSTPTRLGG
jgi:hypothetical protein